MGMINELFDVVSLTKKAQNDLKMDQTNIDALSAAFGKAKSISSKASKYVMEYPVACTTLISNYDTALAISKQIEFDCARFIILSAGLNPVVRASSGDTIEAHISELMSSYESYSGIKVAIAPASQEYLDAGREYVNNILSNEEYNSFNKTSEIAKPIFATEAVQQDVDNEEESTNGDSNNGNNNNNNNGKKTKLPLTADELKDAVNKNNYNYSTIQNMQIINKLGKVAPTIITLKLVISDGLTSRDLEIPLAIKATLQFVDTKYIKDILLGVNIKGHKLLNFIKMTTGQISFFKDWLLAIDSAKKDVDREANIGNTPFFRRLLNNKAKYRIKSISQVIPFLKNIIGKKVQTDLPMCTLIVDETEFSETTKIGLSNCISNRQKYVDPFLDEYMLLGLGIIDNTNDVLHLFYSGESTHVSIKISDLANGSGKGDISSSLASAVANMSKLITKR